MWSTLGTDDVEQLGTWLSVMLQMDPHYAGLTVENLIASAQSTPSQVYFYQGDGFQIALRFAYDDARQNWQWTNLGFIGSVTPAQALSLCIAQFEEFLNEEGIESVTAVRPKTIAYQPLAQLHDLASQDPRLQVSILYESPTAYVWQLQPAA